MLRGRSNLFLIFASLLVLSATPGHAVTKKLIEIGWDEPDPAFMRKHIAQMEAAPFDGCVYHINYRGPDGTPGRFTWEAWGRRAFTRDLLQPAVDDLKATRFRRFRHNFLRLVATPADVDWFDDYSAIVNNARLAAWAAREGGSVGIMFDPEHYMGKLWTYHLQRDAATRSFEEYAAQARRRGRQVMEAFQEGYPDLVLLLAFGYSTPWRERGPRGLPLSECSYGLLAPFLDGMVDAVRGRTRLIDGHELSYPSREPWRFPAAYREIKQGVLPIVADPRKYQRVMSCSFGIWMDYDWSGHGWELADTRKNYHSPRGFEMIVKKALETADEYVWIYSETPRWWTDSGGRVKLPRAYVAALERARAGAARRGRPAPVARKR